MRKVIDLTGQHFGRLRVIARTESHQQGNARWECICECGNKKTVRGADLTRGYTKSCGCLKVQVVRERETRHGKRQSRLYGIWSGMKSRCYNPKRSNYRNYGGRGITVCAEWLENFSAFYDWAMTHGYTNSTTIDRIDNNKGYSPENCRWVSRKVQNNNRRWCHEITFRGETHTLSEWAEITGISRDTLKNRLNLGWPLERALTEPVRPTKRK